MDEAARRLEELLNGIKRKNEMLRQALAQGEADELALSNLLMMAKNWRFVAKEVDGVDLDKLPPAG